MSATCPACGNPIGDYTTIDELQDLMDEHIEHCIPSIRVTRGAK